VPSAGAISRRRARPRVEVQFSMLAATINDAIASDHYTDLVFAKRFATQADVTGERFQRAIIAGAVGSTRW
jgi:hypothetical protein